MISSKKIEATAAILMDFAELTFENFADLFLPILLFHLHYFRSLSDSWVLIFVIWSGVGAGSECFCSLIFLI